MTARRDQQEKAAFVGLGIAACLACCAGPILAVLGGLIVAGLGGTALLGVVGLVVAVPAITAYGIVRRRRRSCSPTAIAPVAIPEPRAFRRTTHAGFNGETVVEPVEPCSASSSNFVCVPR